MPTIRPSEWLTRKEAAAYSTELGYPVEPTTLATMNCKRDRVGRVIGPPYKRINPRRCLYKRSDIERWVEARLSKRRKAIADTDGRPLSRRGAGPQTGSHTEQHAP